MTLQVIGNSQVQIPVEAVAPDAQAGTGSYAVVANSAIDARPWRSIAYTISVADENMQWKVFGANAADFSDEIEVLGETTVNAGANGTYAATQAAYGYYRVKIKNAGAPVGTATVRGIAKR